MREIKRNEPYIDQHEDSIIKALQTQQATDIRRRLSCIKRKRLKSEVIRHYTELPLREAKWSPEAIAGKLTSMGYHISYEAIYQWINIEKPELKSCLWIAGRFRRRRRTGSSQFLIKLVLSYYLTKLKIEIL